MTTNDNTPEKSTTVDKCPWCGSPEDFVYTGSVHVVIYKCCTWKNTINDRSELCRAIEAKNKAEEKIERQAERIRYLEGATNHACGTPLSVAIKRAEKAEAELAEARNELWMWEHGNYYKPKMQEAIDGLNTQKAKLRGLLERCLEKLDGYLDMGADEIRKELEAL